MSYHDLRVHVLPKTVISRYSNTYAKKSKRLGIMILPIWRLEVVISTYSNILLSESMIQYSELACQCAAKYGHLDCLKYLHETAKAPWNRSRVTRSAREKPSRMFTIPPRQRLSSPRRLVVRERRAPRARLFRIRITFRIRIRPL